jgi:hypothetical protein
MRRYRLTFRIHGVPGGPYQGEVEIAPAGAAVPRVRGRGRAPSRAQAIAMAARSALQATRQPPVAALMPGAAVPMMLAERLALSPHTPRVLNRTGRRVLDSIRRIV